MAGGGLALAGLAAGAPGDLDPTFSEDGRLTLERGSDSTAMVVRSDGEIVLAGCSGPRDPRLLARISPSGRFAGKFGSAEAVGCTIDAAASPGGKTVVVGAGPGGGCVATRLTPEGNLDPGFSGDGLKRLRFASARSFGSCPALAVGGRGRVVVLGDDGRGRRGSYHFALLRLRRNGSFDRSFSSDGRLTGRFRRGVRSASPRDVAIGPDGKLVVAGKAHSFAVARFTLAGRPDRTFSLDGRRLIGPRAIGGANAVAIGPHGGLVVAGEVFQGNSERSRRLAAFRLTPLGELDHGFADGGRFYGPVGADVVHDTAAAVALEDDGSVVLAGATQEAGDSSDFGVLRLTPAGELDETFSGDGRVAIGFEGIEAPEGGDFAERIAIREGRIIVVGISEPGLSIARLEGG